MEARVPSAPAGISLENYVVAYVDLQGQSARTLSTPQVYRGGETGESDKEMIVEHGIRPIYALHTGFIDWYRSFSNPANQRYLELLQSSNPEIAENPLRWQPLSDGLAFFVSLRGAAQRLSASSIASIMAAAASEMILSIRRKQPVRGGIDAGWGCELHEFGLCGWALTSAYRLESRVADYPRIAVGESLVALLRSYVNERGRGTLSNINASLAELCLGWIQQDECGIFFLDYLHPLFLEGMRSRRPDVGQMVLDSSVKFLEDQCAHWESKDCDKLANRYRHILHYYRSRLGS